MSSTASFSVGTVDVPYINPAALVHVPRRTRSGRKSRRVLRSEPARNEAKQERVALLEEEARLLRELLLDAQESAATLNAEVVALRQRVHHQNASINSLKRTNESLRKGYEIARSASKSTHSKLGSETAGSESTQVIRNRLKKLRHLERRSAYLEEAKDRPRLEKTLVKEPYDSDEDVDPIRRKTNPHAKEYVETVQVPNPNRDKMEANQAKINTKIGKLKEKIGSDAGEKGKPAGHLVQQPPAKLAFQAACPTKPRTAKSVKGKAVDANPKLQWKVATPKTKDDGRIASLVQAAFEARQLERKAAPVKCVAGSFDPTGRWDSSNRNDYPSRMLPGPDDYELWLTKEREKKGVLDPTQDVEI